ncbi:Regulatory protein AfsR [Streptomyces sp. enrichment culture]
MPGVSLQTHFAVLGPLRACREGIELELGPPKQRGLLALLLLQAGNPLAMQDIVDALWSLAPPESAVNVVQRHIGSLRRLLEPDLRAGSDSRRLLRGSGGYRLEVEPESLDLLRFRRQRRHARQLADSGERVEATEAMLEALAIWRGPAAAGIASDIRSHPLFTAADQEHLAAVKETAHYALGVNPELQARVLDPLRRAAALHPLDEGLHAAVIELLAATGQQAGALLLYRTVRSRIADELGVDPGPELRAAHKAVLDRGRVRRSHMGAVARVATGEQGGPSSSPVRYAMPVRPAQLPPDVCAFSGRVEELDHLRSALHMAGKHASPPVVTVIGGMAGVGKTTLAVHWAHQVAHRFPDGQLFVDLRGFHPAGRAMSASEAMRFLLEGLGVPARSVPADIDSQAALYRSLLAGKRVLIILDNARDAGQILPLLPGGPGSLVIVTSRRQLYGLVASEGALVLTLGPPNEQDALQFLARRLGTDRITGAHQAATEIVRTCGRLPLALAIVSARAMLNPTHSLASIASGLRSAQGSLDGFAVDPPLADARSAFSWSLEALSAGALRMFRLLALHPGPDCSIEAAASLAGEDIAQARGSLSELVQAHLVVEAVPGRFSCHELLRSYGTELNQEQDADETQSAKQRLLDHYVLSAHAANAVLESRHEHLQVHPSAPGVTVAGFADRASAAEWLNTNRSALLSALAQSAGSRRPAHSQ